VDLEALELGGMGLCEKLAELIWFDAAEDHHGKVGPEARPPFGDDACACSFRGRSETGKHLGEHLVREVADRAVPGLPTAVLLRRAALRTTATLAFLLGDGSAA
jgi:hypothetical protein